MASQPPVAQVHGRPRPWFAIWGLIIGILCTVALFAVALLIFLNIAEFHCDGYPFIVLACAIGFGLSTSFLSGQATISGNIPSLLSGLPQSVKEFFGANPLIISVTGGIAVLLLTLIVGNSIEPKSCDFPVEAMIKFRNIPSEAGVSVSDEYWLKRSGSDAGARTFSLLVGNEHNQGQLKVFFDESETQCTLNLTTAPSLQTQHGEEWTTHNHTGPKHEISIHFAKGSIRNNTIRSRHCFTHNGKIILEQFKWIVNARKVMTLRPAPKPENLFDQGGGQLGSSFFPPSFSNYRLDEQSNGHSQEKGRMATTPYSRKYNQIGLATSSPSFQIIPSANAQVPVPPYSEIRQRLRHPNPEVKFDARQELGKNFASYHSEAIDVLLNSESDPEEIVGILVGLDKGIEIGHPELLAEANRNLNVAFPYLSNEGEYLVELTGHRDLGVRNVARRLVQKYPIDSFADDFQRIVSDAKRGQCGLETQRFRVYAAIFFFYNREVQNFLNEKFSIDNLSGFEKMVDDVKLAATKCLDEEYSVDKAVFDYARAAIYFHFKGPKSEEFRSAGKLFLDEMERSDEDYYNPIHIMVLEALLIIGS